jgi:TonB family protein
MALFLPTTLAPRAGRRIFGLSSSCVGFVLSIVTAVTPLEAAGVKISLATGPEVVAMFIKLGHPDYPYEARRARRTGSGIFRIYINPDGNVRTIGVVRSTGYPDLDLAAAAGLYHCLAKPGGRREIDMPVTFTMTRR